MTDAKTIAGALALLVFVAALGFAGLVVKGMVYGYFIGGCPA